MSTTTYHAPPRTILQAYRSLPEGTMAQLIQSQIIMSPAPLDKHQFLSMEIGAELFHHVKTKKLGTLRAALYDVYFDHENAFQPDILFVTNERKHLIDKDGLYGAPDLIIEILSPSTAKYDLKDKKGIYEQYCVKEYWIVEPKDNSVTGYSLINGTFTLILESIGKIESQLLDRSVEF